MTDRYWRMCLCPTSWDTLLIELCCVKCFFLPVPLNLEFHIFVSYTHDIVYLVWTEWSRFSLEQLIAQICLLFFHIMFFQVVHTCQCVSWEQQYIRMAFKLVSPRMAVVHLISAIKKWPMENVLRICHKVITYFQSFDVLVLMSLLFTILGRFQLFWRLRSLYLLGWSYTCIDWHLS